MTDAEAHVGIGKPEQNIVEAANCLMVYQRNLLDRLDRDQY